MTFQQFCQHGVLGQSAATAKQMNDLWLVYASGKVEYDKDSPTGAETPDQGGALSGELLHNDPEDSSEKDTSGGDSASSGDHSDGSSEKTPGGSGLKARTPEAKLVTEAAAHRIRLIPPTQMKTVLKIPAAVRTTERTTAADPKRSHRRPKPADPENPGTETEPCAAAPSERRRCGGGSDLRRSGQRHGGRSRQACGRTLAGRR
ncbi:MAG: hypothetical protein ACLU38_07905 [Dysosmobacter sp.]